MHNQLLFAVAASFVAQVHGHTWVEQLYNVGENGSYFGAAGYIRGYQNRDGQGSAFSDSEMTWLSPQNRAGGSRLKIDSSDVLCHPSQRAANTNAKYPNLKSSAGNSVALRYLENGHVTLPWNQPGKPPSGGLAYIYATTKPQPDTKLVDVLGWTTDNTLEEGRLLNINPYDDGRCYQVNAASNISVTRQADFPNDGHELWCQNNVKIPEDVTSGSTVTLYWVWQWPTRPDIDQGLTQGKDEIYTSCMDVDIASSEQSIKAAVPGVSLGGFEDLSPALKNFAQRESNATNLPTQKYYYNPGTAIAKQGVQSSTASGQAVGTVAATQGGEAATTTLARSAASTRATVASAAATAAFSSMPGVVYVTSTQTSMVTVTVTATRAAAATAGVYRHSRGAAML